MKNLVTGCVGFIGSNLVEYLLNKGIEVIGIDIDKSREHLLPDHKNFTMIWDSIRYLDYYHETFKGVDTIYHLAAASDIARSSINPAYDLAENVVGTHVILETMRKRNIKNMIFTSTSVVYGEDAPRPTPESGIDFDPTSQYGASKCCVESFIHAYVHVYGIKAWIFRFGNVIGRNQHRGVIYDFLNKLKVNPKELEILGDGKQIKSYVHVSDCISAMDWIPKNDGNKGVETYNLAIHDYKNVTELADILCDELGIKPKYNYTGGDRGWVGDVPIVMLDATKALSTGWKPKLNCEEAIRRTVRELSE